ncbi:MAG: hypothetical protein IJ775_03225 [Muribaculaceae bacterium]|nr:hypothetical protein [Muribaculaceae bacterium]
MKWFSFILLSSLLALAACSDSSCYDHSSALPLVRFYEKGTNNQLALTDVILRGVDAPGDSILVNGETIEEAYLPLRANTTTTQWVLEFATQMGLADTITLQYRPIPYFASAECGAMYNFELTSVTSTKYFIDSIAVVKPVINNGTDVAIRMYFPPDE